MHCLKKASALIMLGSMLVSNTYVLSPTTACAVELESNITDNVLAKVNAERAKNGVPAVAKDERLAGAANIRAKEASELWSHTRPDGSVWYTADAQLAYGENLARGYFTSDEIVTAWLNSASHKDVMLQSRFKTAYIAAYVTPYGYPYYAIEFGL